jgi:hypothetical protein
MYVLLVNGFHIYIDGLIYLLMFLYVIDVCARKSERELESE